MSEMVRCECMADFGADCECPCDYCAEYCPVADLDEDDDDEAPR